MSRSRRSRFPEDAQYFIYYTFLYKYLSDNLKNHIIAQMGAEAEDLKRLYSVEDEKAYIREFCLNDLGYFFESYEGYVDQYLKNKPVDEVFSPELFMLYENNLIFDQDSPLKDRFEEIIKIMDENSKMSPIMYNGDSSLVMSSFIHSILNLDISEKCFSFQKVYRQLATSRFSHISKTPEYISEMLTAIVLSQKGNAESVYDPFMNDLSILTSLSEKSLFKSFYGKESYISHYYYSLIRAIIEGFDLSNLHMANENARESMTFGDETFDVIVSKVPNRLRNVSKSRQSLETPNKENVIKNRLFSNMGLDNLDEDEELLNALKIIESKVDAMRKSEIINFDGEYKSLQDSEFLFIINMINCLAEHGIMAISVSQNFLFKNSLTTLRKFLTYENNYIDAIISLPEKFTRVRPEVIIVFRKDKPTDDIMFIDILKDYQTVRSEYAMPGTMRNNLLLSEKTLHKILETLYERKTVDKFSRVVDMRELIKNDFNLTVSRYVDTYEEDYIRLEDLRKDRERIDYNINRLTEKIDKMLDEMNIRF